MKRLQNIGITNKTKISPVGNMLFLFSAEVELELQQIKNSHFLPLLSKI
jgi:hypothetical protein